MNSKAPAAPRIPAGPSTAQNQPNASGQPLPLRTTSQADNIQSDIRQADGKNTQIQEGPLPQSSKPNYMRQPSNVATKEQKVRLWYEYLSQMLIGLLL